MKINQEGIHFGDRFTISYYALVIAAILVLAATQVTGVDRIGIHFGDFLTIHFYALIIIAGILLATSLATVRAKKYGQDPEHILDMFTWVILAGVVGARIWHILTPSPTLAASGITTMYYLTHPLEAINLTKGGLGIVGAVAGGVLALFIYVRRKKLSFMTWLDILGPCVLLAQAIGRWGNFVNQELYGGPTDLPWGLYIEPAYRLPGFENVAYYHPTFLYESLWNIGGVLLMLWLTKRFFAVLKPGDMFMVYLIVYPVGRFLMEMLRLDSSQVGGVNANQALMIPLIIFGIIYLVVHHLPHKKGEAAAS